jgi:hypothetical protein
MTGLRRDRTIQTRVEVAFHTGYTARADPQVEFFPDWAGDTVRIPSRLMLVEVSPHDKEFINCIFSVTPWKTTLLSLCTSGFHLAVSGIAGDTTSGHVRPGGSRSQLPFYSATTDI